MPIEYPNSQNRGSRLSKALSWKTVAALAFISMLFSSFYVDVYRPDVALKRDTRLQELVTLPESVNRGYFRNTFRLDFVPENAYLILSSDDYQLYINGRKIGSNEYTINASNPFTGKLTQRSQSLVRNQQFSLARAPELQKVANRERRYAHYYDLTPYLVAGKNTLSIAVQSDSKVQFSVYGAIQSAHANYYITSNPSEWKYSTLSNADADSRLWFDLNFHDLDWPQATSGGSINYDVYALDNESLWATGFFPPAVIVPSNDAIERIRGRLPGRKSFTTHPEATSWIRIQTSRSYSLYIGDELIGNGSPGQVGAYNISHIVAADEQPLSVIFFPDQLASEDQVWLKLDASIDGNFLPGLGQWQKYNEYSNTNEDWLTENPQFTSNSWESLQNIDLVHPPQKKMYIDQSTDSVFQYLSYVYVTAIAFILLLCLVAIVCGWQKFMSRSERYGHSYWWALALVSTLVVIVQALRYRFVESDAILFFLSDHGRYTFLLLILAALVFWFWRASFSSNPVLHPSKQFFGFTLKPDLFVPWLLFSIIVVGIYLRVFGIDSEDLQADENVSWDAARGILRVGSPEAASGVLYTRSPLYHYLLACWLWLFGDNMIIARLFSVVPAVGSIYLTYLLVKSITKNLWLALVSAFIISFDSWEIQISHIIRFYQQMQFFSLLSTYLFLHGFVWQKGRAYQYGFLAACAAAGLSQEVFVTVFPAFGMAFVIFYRNFDWKKEYSLLIGFITMMAIVVVDIYIFTITCLTPHVSVATTSGSILQFHLSKVLGFTYTFFVGNNRANILMSAIVFIGAFYWIRRNNKAIFCLYLLVGLTALTATVLVMQIAARYLIAIYPYVIILAVLTAYYGTGSIAKQLAVLEVSYGGYAALVNRLRNHWLMIVRSALLVALVINLEPLRVLDSIDHPRFPQHLTALEYISRHKNADDRILSVAPMQAAVAMGGVDYYLQTKLYFDEMYLVDRGVVDRWAGGSLVTSTDKVREIFLRNERVWIILDELEKRNLSDEVLGFLYLSSKIRREFFGVEVLLWERKSGALPITENRGGSYNLF